MSPASELSDPARKAGGGTEGGAYDQSMPENGAEIKSGSPLERPALLAKQAVVQWASHLALQRNDRGKALEPLKPDLFTIWWRKIQ